MPIWTVRVKLSGHQRRAPFGELTLPDNHGVTRPHVPATQAHSANPCFEATHIYSGVLTLSFAFAMAGLYSRHFIPT